jgi:hypothetical protein
MATDRQIAANRRNAANSTGPRTAAGKRRARGNALQHGLTAETVVPALEDAEAYRALEVALAADYDPQTTVERQLVGRLASLLWRLRRASLIETGLFEIQGRFLRQRRFQERADAAPDALSIFHKILHQSHAGAWHDDETAELLNDRIDSDAQSKTSRMSDVPLAFLRLCKFNAEAIERLGRYEIALWRQTVQIWLLLKLRDSNSLRHSPFHIVTKR